MTKKNTGVQDVPVDASAGDLLNIQPYAKALASFASTCPTPMTIAVQGDWGIGKTSLMKGVLSELNPSSGKVHTFWINTWEISQFNLGDSIALTFLSAVIAQMQQQNKRLSAGVQAQALKILKRMGGVIGVAGNILVNASAMAVSGVSVGNMVEGTGIERGGQVNPLEEIGKLRSTFAEMCELLATDSGGRVVFFIDDLDRIHPQRAVELLEVMKNFLDVENVVFVLAIDYDVVKRGLSQKFGDHDAAGAMSGKSFFDKIIQVPFSMPAHAFNLDKYVGTIATDVGLPETLTSSFVETVKTTGLTNPRSIKRAINTLLLQRAVLQIESGAAPSDTATKLTFAVVCLEATAPTQFAALANGVGELEAALQQAGPVGALIRSYIAGGGTSMTAAGIDEFKKVMRNAQLTTTETPTSTGNIRIEALIRRRTSFEQKVVRWLVAFCVERGAGSAKKPNEKDVIQFEEWETQILFKGPVTLVLGYGRRDEKTHGPAMAELRKLEGAARHLRGPGQPIDAPSMRIEIGDGDDAAFAFARKAMEVDARMNEDDA